MTKQVSRLGVGFRAVPMVRPLFITTAELEHTAGITEGSELVKRVRFDEVASNDPSKLDIP